MDRYIHQLKEALLVLEDLMGHIKWDVHVSKSFGSLSKIIWRKMWNFGLEKYFTLNKYKLLHRFTRPWICIFDYPKIVPLLCLYQVLTDLVLYTVTDVIRSQGTMSLLITTLYQPVEVVYKYYNIKSYYNDEFLIHDKKKMDVISLKSLSVPS